MCDPAKGAAGQRTIAVLLPCLLDKGMMSPVTEVRALRCALYLLIKWMDLLSFSHSTEIAFLWVLDSSKYGENELRRIYWGDPRAFVKSSEAEHFLRNKHSHGNLALDQHAAVLLWPCGRCVIVLSSASSLSKHVFLLCPRSLGSCLLVIPFSNVS